MMIGGGLALLTVLAIVVVWSRRGQLPELDSAIHASQFAAWERVAPPDYNIEIEVTGLQPATYVVQVRDHKVVKATRNGTPLLQDRTKGTWSVPGMFDTMELDLANAHADPEKRLTTRSPRVTVRANFDPTWHYPEVYQRIQWGSVYEVEWRVTRFEVVADTATE